MLKYDETRRRVTFDLITVDSRTGEVYAAGKNVLYHFDKNLMENSIITHRVIIHQLFADDSPLDKNGSGLLMNVNDCSHRCESEKPACIIGAQIDTPVAHRCAEIVVPVRSV